MPIYPDIDPTRIGISHPQDAEDDARDGGRRHAQALGNV